jgi:Cu-Zn family superoxide dismutase
VALAACQTKDGANTRTGAEAVFSPVANASVIGAATFKDFGDGIEMNVQFNGPGPGQYRVAVHATGNCSSPNGFSAGPPWAPPGLAAPARVFPFIKNDDSAQVVVRLPGYRLEGPDGVMGRSVVLHSGGTSSLDAQPGVPNDRIGCGIIGPPRPSFFTNF